MPDATVGIPLLGSDGRCDDKLSSISPACGAIVGGRPPLDGRGPLPDLPPWRRARRPLCCEADLFRSTKGFR